MSHMCVQRPDCMPPVSPDDCRDAEAIVKGDETVKKLLRDRYGVTDFEMVVCEPWTGKLAC